MFYFYEYILISIDAPVKTESTVVSIVTVVVVGLAHSMLAVAVAEPPFINTIVLFKVNKDVAIVAVYAPGAVLVHVIVPPVVFCSIVATGGLTAPA
jgi:hypothetical protein